VGLEQSDTARVMEVRAREAEKEMAKEASYRISTHEPSMITLNLLDRFVVQCYIAPVRVVLEKAVAKGTEKDARQAISLLESRVIVPNSQDQSLVQYCIALVMEDRVMVAEMEMERRAKYPINMSNFLRTSI
jgi:hypothetical protein